MDNTNDDSKTRETVKDICEEIKRESIGVLGFECEMSPLPYPLSAIATALEILGERILESHESEMSAKDAEIARLKEQLCHDDGLMNTISLDLVRIKSALLTICTADKTAEKMREIAIDACNWKEANNEAH